MKPRPADVLPDRWYWVRRQGADAEWFPAIWDEYEAWSNQDCWADRHQEVVSWVLIPLPEELMSTRGRTAPDRPEEA